jgi:hypothetical protein
MFTVMSCGTKFEGKVMLDNNGDRLTFIENRTCGCVPISPVPCFAYCGVGPCAMQPRFSKESDTKAIGTGESVLAGLCLQPPHPPCANSLLQLHPTPTTL